MKKATFSILFSIAALFLGYLASQQVKGFLGIRYKTKPGVEETLNPTASADTVSLRPLQLRLADLGGVGILPDTANWGNSYQHNVHRFEDLIMAEPPFLNPVAYQRIENELDMYLDKLQSMHINGVVFPCFLELVTFDESPRGEALNSGDGSYRERHLALQKGFGKWIKKISDRGMQVYLYTDMVALTPPIEKYLLARFGKVDGTSEGFWEIYQAASEEIYRRLPGVSGIMLRIGEAGSIYNKPGWDYYSRLAVKTDEAVEKMLTAFLQMADIYQKKIIFRSWSVGVGQIGDMHTNPVTYERVLGKIHSKNLVVSTKYSRGDFYAWLPFNETLLQGEHRRIAEFQLRREFEGFNAFPDYMAPLYQKALVKFTRQNPAFDGVWMWTQEGGPLRAGPLSIYPFHGFNTVTDLNVFAMGRLMANPNGDIGKITADWAGMNFGEDSLLKQTVTEVMMGSHATTRKGLYIGPFARYDVRALGLEPPPMLWIFEWDIVGGSPSVFSNIYVVSKDSIAAAIAEGHQAVNETAGMLARLQSVSSRVTANRDRFNQLVASVAYQHNLFRTLAVFREYMLTYYQWLDKGGPQLRNKWQDALGEYRSTVANHTASYGKNLDFPAYNFREADAAAKIAGRTGMVVWLARILALIVLAVFILGIPIVNRNLPNFPGRRSAAMLWYGVVNPGGSSSATCERADTAPLMLFSVVWLTLSLAVFTSFAAPVFVISLLVLSLAYVLMNLSLSGVPAGCDKVAKGFSLLAPAVAFTGLLMLFSARRGPVEFWFLFWTSASFRAVFLMVFVLFIFRAYYTWAGTLHKAQNISVIKTIFIMLPVQGILLAATGGLVALIGFEKVLTILNDELMMLPGGLSRILGITTHLEIPTDIPVYVMYAGLGMIALGAALVSVNFIILKNKNTA